jgi:hypothetical protein
MRSTRFYRPVLAKLRGREALFAKQSLAEAYREGASMDVPAFDFTAPDSRFAIKTRRTAVRHKMNSEDFEPDFFDMGPFQITYKFPSARRNNRFPLLNPPVTKGRGVPKGEYGAPGWSFRMLYEFLCASYNNGELFIDTYFASVFKMRPVYRRLLDIYKTIQRDIDAEQKSLYEALPRRKDGLLPDRRFREFKKFSDFRVWGSPVIKSECGRLAAAIRTDIEECLRTGILPLRGGKNARVAAKWQLVRAGLGGMVHLSRLFYASGQLIQSLQIFVEIGDVTPSAALPGAA